MFIYTVDIYTYRGYLFIICGYSMHIYLCLFILWIYIHIYSYCGYILHICLCLFILWIYIHIVNINFVNIYSYRGYLFILLIYFVKDKVSVSDTNFLN